MSELTQEEQIPENILQETATAWPDWLLERYGQLSLPSLYDFLLSQEKLACEIRKQNKELAKHSELIDNFGHKLEQESELIQNLSYQLAEASEPQIVDDNKALFLMEIVDMFFSLSEATKNTSQLILATVPNKRFFGIPTWRRSLENILEGYTTGVDIVRKKILGWIADANISLIIPELKASFDPSIHRAVERISGGEHYTIAKIIRFGYRCHHQILRPADVTIYE